MLTTSLAMLCSTCGTRLARDHDDAVCSPCRRSAIERSARRAATINRDAAGTKKAFDTAGLLGVADHLGCSLDEALDAVLCLRLVPPISPRRRATLSQLFTMNDQSHVAAAAALHISRWTVATYRQELGIDKLTAGSLGAGK